MDIFIILITIIGCLFFLMITPSFFINILNTIFFDPGYKRNAFLGTVISGVFSVYILNSVVQNVLSRSWQNSKGPLIVYCLIAILFFGVGGDSSKSPHIGTYKFGIIIGIIAGAIFL